MEATQANLTMPCANGHIAWSPGLSQPLPHPKPTTDSHLSTQLPVPPLLTSSSEPFCLTPLLPILTPNSTGYVCPFLSSQAGMGSSLILDSSFSLIYIQGPLAVPPQVPSIARLSFHPVILCPCTVYPPVPWAACQFPGPICTYGPEMQAPCLSVSQTASSLWLFLFYS